MLLTHEAVLTLVSLAFPSSVDPAVALPGVVCCAGHVDLCAPTQNLERDTARLAEAKRELQEVEFDVQERVEDGHLRLRSLHHRARGQVGASIAKTAEEGDILRLISASAKLGFVESLDQDNPDFRHRIEAVLGDDYLHIGRLMAAVYNESATMESRIAAVDSAPVLKAALEGRLDQLEQSLRHLEVSFDQVASSTAKSTFDSGLTDLPQRMVGLLKAVSSAEEAERLRRTEEELTKARDDAQKSIADAIAEKLRAQGRLDAAAHKSVTEELQRQLDTYSLKYEELRKLWQFKMNILQLEEVQRRQEEWASSQQALRRARQELTRKEEEFQVAMEKQQHEHELRVAQELKQIAALNEDKSKLLEELAALRTERELPSFERIGLQAFTSYGRVNPASLFLWGHGRICMPMFNGRRRELRLYPDAQPMSWSDLSSTGCMGPTEEGLMRLWLLMGDSRINDRPTALGAGSLVFRSRDGLVIIHKDEARTYLNQNEDIRRALEAVQGYLLDHHQALIRLGRLMP